MHIGGSIVAASIYLGGLGGAVAHAETAIVGDTSLTPTEGVLDFVGPKEAPVFQFEAGSGYTVSSTQTGTLTDFSFLSAGAAPGTHFALAVLRQAETASHWTLESVSAPVAVTTQANEDAVNGPYPINLAIAAGDRIGLEPIDSEDVPIERTVDPADVVRSFASPFAGAGGTQELAPGPLEREIVPLQATVTIAPTVVVPPPSAPAPPVDVTPPTVVGTPQAGQTLRCEPGTWTNSPTFTVTWSQTTETLVAGAKPPRVISTSVEVASGPTYMVPDIPEGVSISCTVTASNAGTVPGAGPTASSTPVAVQPLAPALAPSFSFVYHTKRNMPTVSKGVGYGGTNVCHPGLWLHYPAQFYYRWFEEVYAPRLHRDVPKYIWGKQQLKITERLELHEIYCRVTAVNSVGQASATSNTVFVPKLAPVALGPVRLEVVEPVPPRVDPATSPAEPLASEVTAGFTLRCLAPHYNRHVTTTYTWEAQLYAISKSSADVPAGPFNPSESLGTPSNTITIAPEGEPARTSPNNEPLFDGVPPTVPFSSWNGELAVRCAVKARLLASSVYSVTNSAVFYLLLPAAVPGTIGGRVG